MSEIYYHEPHTLNARPALLVYVAAGNLLRSLWPVNEVGTTVSVRQWADDIGITPYTLVCFLAGTANHCNYIKMHRIKHWIEEKYGPEMSAQWMGALFNTDWPSVKNRLVQ